MSPKNRPASETLNTRQQQVLTAIVDHFIVTAEPVSSKLLSLNPVLHASSATLRNTMAELTERGFIEQAHASAGRRPTDQGYQTYVDALMQPHVLSPSEKQALESPLQQAADEQEMLNLTAITLSRMTQLMGVAVTPSVRQGTFKHLSLHAMDQGRIMVVLQGSGLTIRSVLSDETPTSSIYRLDSLAHRLNAEMQGRPIAELGRHLSQASEKTMTPDEAQALGFLRRSILKLFDAEPQQELQISGAHHLVKPGNFEKIEDLESLLEMIESKIALVHFLRNQASTQGVHVTIGQEKRDGKAFRSLAIVTEAFGQGESKGLVGVMGPKRLPYSHLVALVHHAAKTLNGRVLPQADDL